MKPKPLVLEDLKEKIEQSIADIVQILVWKDGVLVTETITKEEAIKRGIIKKTRVVIDYEKAKQRIREACEFYLRYRNRPERLWNERKEYRKKVRGFLVHNTHYFYNEWLFKLTFKSVFEDKDGDNNGL